MELATFASSRVREGPDAGVDVAVWVGLFTGPSRNPSVFPEHEAARQELLDTDGMLWKSRLHIASTVFAFMLGSEERVVNGKKEVLEAMCGSGGCNSSVLLLRELVPATSD